MVVTRSGEHVTITANDEGGSNDVAPDSYSNPQGSPGDDEDAIQEGFGKISLFRSDEDAGTDDEEEVKENDLDSETMHNTQVNECMTPKRMFRRRASSKLHPSPDSNSKSDVSPPKHVQFIDEPRPACMIESHKTALHNPRASEKRKEHAQEVLDFHGKSCE
ncbi:hypothetical protein A7U60_g5967 [Sanghuangporus baumii]|uniref:Uncharacterized protein n=1 Tax=Sanghuangporus baumii TaxID=108892 RepID=A0A9Q5NAU8_SANBA|nr:hypothetical protein A7U60_g5967 [Sanghuangporus baumii]